MDSSTQCPAVRVEHLAYTYRSTEAVHDLNFEVSKGRCYGLFGRNGAGKTTTIKCLLNLLCPTKGQVRVFGLDPAGHDVEVKSRLAYVPDYVAFYPWMSVRETLDYLRSFRRHWNGNIERDLLQRFRLDEMQKTGALSKGQRTQLALIGAISPEPELLLLDEPTSGLDPIVRREFIQTVIGAYQESDPGNRTIVVSTHLISEFEGLIDEFTIVDQGRDVLSITADAARDRYQKIRARFPGPAPERQFSGALAVKRQGRDLELVANGQGSRLLAEIRGLGPESVSVEALSLEEMFISAMK